MNVPLAILLILYDSRAGYDTKTNSLKGFDFPLQPDGYPEPNASIVKTAVDIFAAFQTRKKASVVSVCMAQPLCDGSSPLRLFSIANANRYKSEDLASRMETLCEELAANGIETLVYSADGDSREMKFMRQMLHLGLPLKRPGNSLTRYFFI